MNETKGKIAVLISGRGSNLKAIYESSRQPKANFRIAVVISDKKHAKGLDTALSLGIPAYHIKKMKADSKSSYESKIVEILNKYKIELVCLAGYMKIVGNKLLESYTDKILNIHPSLLPSFPGLDAQKQALEYGAKVSGCSVHFVDNGMDTGPIIIQKSVIIEEDDTEESLKSRILKEEHVIYSEAIKLFFQKRLKILRGRRVEIK